MEIKDFAEAVENTATAVTDIATGAAQSAVEAVSRPGSLARKGGATRRQARRDLAGDAEEARKGVEDVMGALLPERIALQGLSLVKARARRVDLVGEIAYRGLDLFHVSLKELAGAITRLERASQPPARPGRSARASATPARSARRRPARKSATRTRRTAA